MKYTYIFCNESSPDYYGVNIAVAYYVNSSGVLGAHTQCITNSYG